MRNFKQHLRAYFRIASTLTMIGLVACQTTSSTQTAEHCGERDGLSMVNLQYVGSHNSYHIAPPAKAFDWLGNTRPERAAQQRQSLDYTHSPLKHQLNSGQRMLELDIYADPNGGRFSVSKLREITGIDESATGVLSYDESILLAPGLKTVHYPNFDLNSHCPIFQNCLAQIKTWHDDNPGHLPLVILIEAKEGHLFDMHRSSNGDSPVSFSEQDWNSLDNSILQTFERSSIIFPTDVIEEDNGVAWPSIDNSKGKIAFLLFDYGKSVSRRYVEHAIQSNQSTVLHLQKDTPTIPSSWVRQSVPDIFATLKALKTGKLVYSKADTTGIKDSDRRATALASGANLVATDYPKEFDQKVRIRRQCE